SAVQALSLVSSVERVSRVYRTAPVGPAQPEFLNAAALVVYQGRPETLLDRLQAIETAHGRSRAERWGPRTLDLDLLWMDGMEVDMPRLTVPHARLRERAFALVPMLELVPHARDPHTGQPYVTPPGDVRLTDLT